MKTNKRAVFFLFLCMMGALMLTMTSSQSLLPNDSIVYAEEDEDDEVEENAPAPVTNSNGRYETLQIPSILSTAYADGLRGAQMSEDDGETADQFKKNMDTILGDRPVTLDEETGEVVSTGTYRFDTMGILMGPMSGASGSGTQDVRETLSMSLDELRNVYNYDHSGEAYWAFGRAVQNLRVDAEKADTSTIDATAGVDTLAGVSRQVSDIGIKLLKNWSPAPVVLAFMDENLLYSPKYEGNRLIGIINESEPLERVIQIMGQPVPGREVISYSQLVMIVLIMFGLVGSVLTKFMGTRFLPVSIRKTFVKVLVMIVAVPLTMYVYDWGLDALDDIANADSYSTEYQHARSHLLLGLWAEYGFAAPSGVTLNVRDGRFMLSRDDIRAINAMVLGLDGSDENENEIIADAIIDNLNSDDNETHISWQNKMLPVQNRPWQTDVLIQLAEAIGSNQDIEDSGIVMENWRTRSNYIYGGNLRAYVSDSETGAFDYKQTGGRVYSAAGGGAKLKYGLSPIATYNLLNTQFSTNSLTVKSNLSTGSTIPSVAPTAYAYAVNSVMGSTESDLELPSLVRWFLDFTLLIASIKALAKIITAGFGGMVHGGARSMFGSSAGWGELFGAVFAAIFGVMGLSFFSLVTLTVAESLYGLIHEMTSGMIDSSTLLSTGVKSISHLFSPTGFISWIPGVSDPIANWIEGGLISILSGILAMFFLPKFVRIPIEAFAGWISTLPTTWADKAQRIESRFTGDTLGGGGGRPTGALAGALEKAGEGMVNSGKAVAAGAGLMAGAGVKAGGGAIKNKAGEILAKRKEKKDGGKDDGGESESIAAAAISAEEPETDEKGNPITENITDNDGNTEDEKVADENITDNDGNTEDEKVADENITDNDGNTEDKKVADENITDNDGNTEDKKVADETNKTGDVNTEDEKVADETNKTGDVNTEEEESIADGIESIGGGYGVDADGNLVNGDGEAIMDSDGNNIQPKLNNDGQLDSASANANGHMLNDSGEVALDADGNPIPIFQPGGGNENDTPTGEGDATNGDITEGSINEGELSQNISANDEDTQGDVNADESSSDTDSSTNTSTATDDTSSNQSSLNVGGTSSESIDSNNTSSGDTVSGGEVSTNDTSSGDSIASSGGEVSTNETSSGDTVSGGEVSTNETSSGDSIASSGGEVNTSDTSSGDSIASSGGEVSTNDTSSGDTVSGGEVNTSDEISGGSIASSGDDVNTSQDTSGGDVNSSQVSTGSEDGGTTETTESGVHSDSHSESTMGGQTSESGQGSGASVSNDSTIEGSQVTQDTSQNNDNVTTDSNNQVNASSEERTTNQGDSADNSQRADVKSNTETVNDNQSSNTSIGGSQGSPTKPSTQGGQSPTKPTSQGGSPTSQGGSKVTSKPSTGGGQSAEKPSSRGSQTGEKKQPNRGSKPSPSGGTKVSTTGGTRPTSSSNNRRPNISSIVGGRNAGGQTRRPSATVGKDGSIASNKPPQSAGQGAQNTKKPSGKENTSQKASRISEKIGRGSAQQGGVSNAQQAAMGAVHMLGGITGMENVTQQGVNNLRSKQGKGVNSKQTSKKPNQSQNPTQNESDRQQQIIDMERRREEEQSKRVKKPSFIKKVRNKGKNNKR